MTADAPINFCGRRLVIFGAGYVGLEMAKQAVARRLCVTALTRNSAKARELEKIGAETVVADLSDANWHRKLQGPADFVVNCVSSGGAGLEGYRRSYCEGMNSVLHWAHTRSEPAGPFVWTSSTSVYPQDGGVLVDEVMPVGGSERAAILVEAEALAATWPGRAFILRLAGIYGPGRHHLLDQLRTGATELAGRGAHRLNLAHRDDICAAIWAALTAAPVIPGGIFNVADDAPATKSEVIAWLAGRLGVSAPVFTGQTTTNARRADTPDRHISNQKMKNVLGWRPAYPSFREGYTAILSPPARA